MVELSAGWWFAAAAAGMVALALLIVLPHRLRSPGAASAVAGGSPAHLWRAAPWFLLPAGAAALYMLLGDPAALNRQRGELSAQLREAETPLDDQSARQVYTELQRHLQRQPDDARAWVTKARLDMQAQRFEQAAAAYERALRGSSKTVGDASVWVEYAEARGMLQGGTLAGPPRQMVDKALSINPDHPQALDLAGSAAWEAGDFAQSVLYWQRLLAQIPEGSPRHVQLAAAIQRAEQRAAFVLPRAH